MQQKRPIPGQGGARTARPRGDWRQWLAISLVGVVVLFVAITLFVFAILKRSEPAMFALQRASAHPAVVAKIGTPLVVGWVVTGSLKYNGSDSGTVRLSLPVRGPQGRGTITIRGVRADGGWTYTILRLVPDDASPPIDLGAG